MTQTSGPFDGTDLDEAGWDLMLAKLVDGVHGVPGSSLLNATVSATTRGVDFAAGTASAAGHWYRNSATLTKTSGANAAGSARIDRGVLACDLTANTVTIEVVAGTAGSGQPPALADTSTLKQRPLWKWTVGPGASAVTALTDERQWMGTLIRPCTSSNRPYAPATGDVAGEIDTGRLIRWAGSEWVSLNQDTGYADLTLNVSGGVTQGGVTLAGRVINGIAYLKGTVDIGPIIVPTGGLRIANLPGYLQPTKTIQILVYQDGGTLLLAAAYASGSRDGQLWLVGNLGRAASNTTLHFDSCWPV